MTVSIIIPARTVTAELTEALPHLLALKPRAEEIIVVLDQQPLNKLPAGIKLLIQAGGPAVKRDFAASLARGDILAFLDDDAYPKSDWLANALPHFTDPSVAAVGGPAVTPTNDGWQAQLSGAVLTSWLGTGPAQMRYWPVGSVRDVDDWPSVNLIVRRQAFVRIGGFSASFWPGEDTKLCLDIVRQGWRIVYDPKVLVFHHRATTVIRHFKQIGRYGLHRGYYAKIFPQTSWRISYFLPAIFLVGAATSGLLVLNPTVRPWLAVTAAIILTAAFLAGLTAAARTRKYYLVLALPWLIITTHMVYGAAFIWGLTSPKLGSYQRWQR